MQSLKSPSIDVADGFHAETNWTFGNDLPLLLKLIEAQRKDTYCKKIHQYLGLTNTSFTHEKDEILERRAPIDGAFRRVVPISLYTWIWNLPYYCVLGGHLGTFQVNDSLRQEFYWVYMVRDFYTVFNNCVAYPHMRYQTVSSEEAVVISTYLFSWVFGHRYFGTTFKNQSW